MSKAIIEETQKAHEALYAARLTLNAAHSDFAAARKNQEDAKARYAHWVRVCKYLDIPTARIPGYVPWPDRIFEFLDRILR